MIPYGGADVDGGLRMYSRVTIIVLSVLAFLSFCGVSLASSQCISQSLPQLSREEYKWAIHEAILKEMERG